MDEPTLTDELRYLWQQAGRPTLRTISLDTGGKVSHSAISMMISGKSNPRWENVEAVTKALGGDIDAMKVVWERSGRAVLGGRSSDDALVEAINGLTKAIQLLTEKFGEQRG